MKEIPHIVHRQTIQLLFGALVFALLLFPQNAGAFFAGMGDAETNAFSTATLAVDIVEDSLAAGIAATGTSSAAFNVIDSGTIAAQYELTVGALACSSSFFNEIDVVVAQGGVVYSGPLNALSATSTNVGTWDIEFSASSDLVAGEDDVCDITLTIDAWQDAFTAPGSGFSDTTDIILTITASEDIGAQPTATVVLNEIYPNEIATTTEPLDREWVELYNGTGSVIDVSEWAIGELTSGTGAERLHEIVATCPASSVSKYAQPYGGAGTTIAPGGLLVVEFCGSASYLSDGGDTVSLYTATTSVVTIDLYTYPSTVVGKSHARIPDGAVWVDPIPTPGTPNTATEDELRNEGWSEEKIAETIKKLEEIIPNECTDNVDNDGDGWVDEGDAGCEGPDDMTEGHPYEMEVFLGIADEEDVENRDIATSTATSTPEVSEDGTTGQAPPLSDTLGTTTSDGTDVVDTGTSTPPLNDEVGTSTPPIQEEVEADGDPSDEQTVLQDEGVEVAQESVQSDDPPTEEVVEDMEDEALLNEESTGNEVGEKIQQEDGEEVSE